MLRHGSRVSCIRSERPSHFDPLQTYSRNLTSGLFGSWRRHGRTSQRPGLLIFDCDGVLIDSQNIQCEVDAAELTRLGYPITDEELARHCCDVATQALRPLIDTTPR